MTRPIQFAIVVIIGVGLLTWLVLAQRYQYFPGPNPGDVLTRNDGLTGARQALRCKDQPTGKSVLRVVPPSAAAASLVGPEEVAHLPLSVEELTRVNQMRQEHHLPQVDVWGRTIVRDCRWENISP